MLIKKYLSAWIGLLRVPTYLLILQYVAIGLLYGLSIHIRFFSFTSYSYFALSLVSIFMMLAFWYVNGTALNDLSDYEIDLINLKNDKNRPLVMGTISKQQLANIAFVSGLIAVLFGIFLGRNTFILVTILLLLNWAYSMKPIQISHRGGFAPTLLPLGYVVLPLLSGYFVVTDELNGKIFLFTIALYLLFCSRILLKDFRDVVGDARHGKITYLLKHGTKNVSILAGVTFFVGFLLLIVKFWRILSVHVFPMLFFMSIGLTILYYLSQTKTWMQQKTYITIFGRTGTGILILIAIALSFQYKPVILWKQFIVSVALAGLIINSFGEIISAQRSK